MSGWSQVNTYCYCAYCPWRRRYTSHFKSRRLDHLISLPATIAKQSPPVLASHLPPLTSHLSPHRYSTHVEIEPHRHQRQHFLHCSLLNLESLGKCCSLKVQRLRHPSRSCPADLARRSFPVFTYTNRPQTLASDLAAIDFPSAASNP